MVLKCLFGRSWTTHMPKNVVMFSHWRMMISLVTCICVSYTICLASLYYLTIYVHKIVFICSYKTYRWHNYGYVSTFTIGSYLIFVLLAGHISPMHICKYYGYVYVTVDVLLCHYRCYMYLFNYHWGWIMLPVPKPKVVCLLYTLKGGFYAAWGCPLTQGCWCRFLILLSLEAMK